MIGIPQTEFLPSAFFSMSVVTLERTMRIISLSICLWVLGCDNPPSRTVKSVPATVATAQTSVSDASPTLHTDAFAVNLMKVIGMKDEDEDGYRVPEDEVQTIGSVFLKFGINPDHLGTWSQSRFNNARWIWCQLSPSYGICFAIDGWKEVILPINNPNRQVFSLVVNRIER
jgi:hypothetical protein